MTNPPVMLWTDCETTGLDEKHDVVLEVGFKITDIFGARIAQWKSLVSDVTWLDRVEDAEQDEFVGPMHRRSGLWSDWKKSLDDESCQPRLVQDSFMEWAADHDIRHGTLPMCGSTVHFDRMMYRRWLPDIETFFHYRNIDMSTLKELCQMLNPSIWSGRGWSDDDKFHRPFEDINHSLEEYKFYRENFLWVDTPYSGVSGKI